jgi:hypothetical protein
LEFYYFRYHILVVGDISKLIYKPIRHGLPYLVVLIISSPSVIFINPVLPTASAAPLPTISTIPLAPSTIGQDGKEGDFTTQQHYLLQGLLKQATLRTTNHIMISHSKLVLQA